MSDDRNPGSPSVEQRLAVQLVSGIIDELLFSPEQPSFFAREILDRLAVESLTIAVGDAEATFSIRVRERRGASRSGTASFAIPSPLPEAWQRSGLPQDLVNEFICELNEDVLSEESPRMNVLRWD